MNKIKNGKLEQIVPSNEQLSRGQESKTSDQITIASSSSVISNENNNE
jgi:hypothetical protein